MADQKVKVFDGTSWVGIEAEEASLPISDSVNVASRTVTLDGADGVFTVSCYGTPAIDVDEMGMLRFRDTTLNIHSGTLYGEGKTGGELGGDLILSGQLDTAPFFKDMVRITSDYDLVVKYGQIRVQDITGTHGTTATPDATVNFNKDITIRTGASVERLRVSDSDILAGTGYSPANAQSLATRAYVLANTGSYDDTQIKADLASETEARESADTTLQANINSEASTRSAADVALTAVDVGLQNQIDNLDLSGTPYDDTQIKADLAAETVARSTADASLTTVDVGLQNQIDNLDLSGTPYDDTQIKADLATETAARQNADVALQQNIGSEATTRSTADTALTAVDVGLQNQIDNLDLSGYDDTQIKADLASEVSARQSADTALQAGIDSNSEIIVTNRTHSDTRDDAIWTQLQLDTAAISANATAIAGNTASISQNEGSIAGNTIAIESNSSSISSETAARKSADTILQQNIDANSGAIVTNKTDSDTRDDAIWEYLSTQGDDAASGETCGRLTVSSGDALSEGTSTTLFFTPFMGEHIALFDGTAWVPKYFEELSVDLTQTPGAARFGTLHDVFIFIDPDDSSLLKLKVSPWNPTTETAPNNNVLNAQSRTIPLSVVNGVYVSNPSAKKRYLGTINIDSSGQTKNVTDRRWVWNLSHGITSLMDDLRPYQVYTYGSAVWRNMGATDYHMEFVTGLPGGAFSSTNCCMVTGTSASRYYNLATSVNGVITPSLNIARLNPNVSNAQVTPLTQGFAEPYLGLNRVYSLELCDAGLSQNYTGTQPDFRHTGGLKGAWTC